jgi:hypothetical protein
MQDAVIRACDDSSNTDVGYHPLCGGEERRHD